MSQPTIALAADFAYTNRAAEVPNAAWDNGCNAAGPNAPGIGINIGDGAISGEPQQFTLLDQAGLARTPQLSSVIGILGYTDPDVDWPGSGGTSGPEQKAVWTGTNDADGLGVFTQVNPAWLQTLSAGWIEDPTP
jgi:hypothetical protein